MIRCMHTPRANGFTLVELSIVLVILGLLVGGVLSGQSLIRAAELRSITKEFNAYVTATNSFRDKYQALPGDMKNAVKFWGAADGGTADGIDAACLAVNTPPTGTETCNGNGDGKLDEIWRYWQHLANAGLIEGTFYGFGVPGDGGIELGKNSPASKLSGAGWNVTYLGQNSGDTIVSDSLLPDGKYGHTFTFGGTDPGEPLAIYGAIKAEEAYNIDMKLDDGLPHKGSVRTVKHGNGVATNCMNDDDDAYRVADQTANNCSLLFIVGW